MNYYTFMEEEILDKVLIKLINIEEKLENFVTKDDLLQSENRVLGDVDRFIKLHETLDQELASLRNKYSRLEDRLVVLERKLQVA